MSDKMRKVLVVGATGSIGRLVVAEAQRKGFDVRALVRDAGRGRQFGHKVELAIGDLTNTDSLKAAVEDIDAVIFTHGSDGGGKIGAETVDYGGVRNILALINRNDVRIALMTAIGVTNRTGSYNLATESHDWKRRAERLVRASGLSYTIVRPGWFDYNDANQHKLVFLQGDKRQSGTPSDGVIARQQIAEVLVASLTSEPAARKTFELVAESGPAQPDLDVLFAELQADIGGALDAVSDTANMPANEEPSRVTADMAEIRTKATSRH
ncbi:SDR family oxidoreductase [Rhizobium sp. 2MFCol3.1]|uniref:SDR family oxidoreductase n=1 Tax=Rhizobium sp. 2MFCol3.1 TaxID=1246459 RepID=UPI00035DE065|nr:SDR family oxidoreductase [Rhizobium sp. 2MFCol3.1]